MSDKRPSITWPDLLLSAPYFTTALLEAECAVPPPQWAPLPRAVIFWNMLDGEVSNGGVAQYFYNRALYVPEFDQIPEFIAAHPVLAPHAHFAQTIHAAWSEVAPAVIESRESEEWPEDLFKSLEPKFEALQTAFYAVNHDIAQALNAHLLAHPHEYFDIAPLKGVAEKGVSWVECQNKGYRGKLRFLDGFPVGPNVFERGEEGDCDVVWFTRDRQVMTSHADGRRMMIHYPSLRSHEMSFDEDRLEHQESSRSFWYAHGLDERYTADGKIESSVFHAHNKELLSERYHTNGQLWLRSESRDGETHCWRYWTNGQLNTYSTRPEEDTFGAEHYLSCLAEDGSDLAPQGTGKFRQCLGDDWREGVLVNGLLEGEMIWYNADGTASSKGWFEKGVGG